MRICNNDKAYKNYKGEYCYLDSFGEETCFESPEELISFIEADLPLSDDEKEKIRNL